MTKRRVGATLLLGCAVIAGGARSDPAAAQPARQALDPLSAEEKAAAERLVRADPRARELLGDGATLASIELLAMKGERADDSVRHADLLFALPGREFGARAIVSLGATPSIAEFTRVDAKSVPMTDADVQEVWKIALADDGYRRRLDRDSAGLKPEALRIYTDDREDPCFSGRCFYLIVRDGDYYVSKGSATVDLATRRVLTERSPR